MNYCNLLDTFKSDSKGDSLEKHTDITRGKKMSQPPIHIKQKVSPKLPISRNQKILDSSIKNQEYNQI